MPSDDLDQMFFRTMDSMMHEEKQAPCIHCGEVWYVIHHRDGVCHSCQKLGKPGRQKMAQIDHDRLKIRFWITMLIMILVSLAISLAIR